jgi:hypothetical protein
MDMKCETRNVRGLHRAGSLKTVASDVAKCNVDLVAVQEDRWVEGGSQAADDYTLLAYGNVNANRHLGTGFFIHNGIISAVKTEEFISHSMSYAT